MHGYFQKIINKDESIDEQHSQLWLQDKYLNPTLAAYACAIQEQEIVTQY